MVRRLDLGIRLDVLSTVLMEARPLDGAVAEIFLTIAMRVERQGIPVGEEQAITVNGVRVGGYSAMAYP